MPLSVKIYRLLVRAYPAHFSDRYAEEMVSLFSDQLMDAGREGQVMRLWVRTMKDWLRSVPAEHARGFRPGSAVKWVLVFAPNVAFAAFLLAGIFGYRAVRK